jgi:signal transduction histidine kinase/ligand-binding sensor domain-containing protein/CheY-like chemotaxis protein
MNFRRIRLLIIFYCLCHFSISYAQLPVSFHSKNTQDGLCDNWVRCVYQDQRGFMWFGTASGLNRYDGVNFKHYPFNYTNINAIITKDSKHMLICTDIGIYIYNIYTHKTSLLPIKHIAPVLSTTIDDNGMMWFGTSSGLIRYNQHTQESILYTHSTNNPLTISNNYVNTLLVDEDNNIWVGTKNGLNKFNQETQSFTHFQTDLNCPELQSNDILALALDYEKRLWVGSARGGLSVFTNPHTQTNDLQGKAIFSGNIITLRIDSKNNLWIGRGSGEGLNILDLKHYKYSQKATLHHYRKTPSKPNSLSDNSIFYIYEDNLEDIWIGTFGGGINYTSKRAKKFHKIDEYRGNTKILSSNLTNCFLEDGDRFWIGTESGLDCWNRKILSFTTYINEPSNPSSLQGNSVYSIAKDTQGNLWIGTWSGGLNKFNYKTETFTHIPLGKNPINNVFAIEADSLGHIWVGTVEPSDGLYRYTIETGEVQSFYKKAHDSTSISSNSINDILITKNNTVYISTFHGIDVYNRNTKTFTDYSLPNFSGNPNSQPYISGLYQNSRGDILVGTNYGVITFDTSTHEFKKTAFFHNYSSTIQGIVEDSHKTIWISTLEGISRFIPSPKQKKATIQSFTYLDGISGNETKPRAIYKDSQGYIFVGTSQGFTYFHEDSIFINTTIPPIEITDMLLLKYVPNENAEYIPITQSSFPQDTIILDYTSSDFIIKYAALNYLVPEKNRYSYKLKGYDSEWIDAGTQTSVTYTNIQPGSYTFMVKGSNNDGIWNPNPSTLTLIIQPPWWQTSYFYVGAILLFILIVWTIIKLRLAMYAKQKKILTQKVQERTQELSQTNTILQEKQEEISHQNAELFRHRNELQELVDERTADLLVAKQKAEESDRLKSAFLSNMSHEIRTPMNGIVGFSEMLISDELREEEKQEYARVISESSKQLLRIVDDILDISRIETGAMTLNTETVCLQDFMEDVRRFFEPQARTKKITYTQDVPNEPIYFEIDTTKLFQIISNLLNNALKFTSKGEIECGAVFYETSIQFYVKDTGIGIPKQLHEKIFERFRQAELTISRTFGGTGLGLAISKKLIKLFKGEIWIESEVNVGSNFYFSIPFTPSEKPEHKEPVRTEEFYAHTHKQVLIAEDNHTNYYYLEQLLSHAKIPVVRAKNGEEAISMCKENENIGLILMDVRMPVKDGISASKDILKLYPNMPILIQTAFVLTLQKEEIYKIGCVGIVPKPIKREELFSYIARYL